MEPQLSLVDQLLHKVSHKQDPGNHEHDREDKRDSLQVPVVVGRGGVVSHQSQASSNHTRLATSMLKKDFQGE